jgi:hypothetical protein
VICLTCCGLFKPDLSRFRSLVTIFSIESNDSIKLCKCCAETLLLQFLDNNGVVTKAVEVSKSMQVSALVKLYYQTTSGISRLPLIQSSERTLLDYTLVDIGFAANDLIYLGKYNTNLRFYTTSLHFMLQNYFYLDLLLIVIGCDEPMEVRAVTVVSRQLQVWIKRSCEHALRLTMTSLNIANRQRVASHISATSRFPCAALLCAVLHNQASLVSFLIKICKADVEQKGLSKERKLVSLTSNDKRFKFRQS